MKTAVYEFPVRSSNKGSDGKLACLNKDQSMIEKSITSFDDLQFSPLSEGNPVEAALLWGDPATGPAALVIRMPPGHEEPLHSHTSTYRTVLIKGEIQSRSNDDATDIAEVFGPGAYMVQPGGQSHSEVNAGSVPVVALVFFDGPVDFVPSK
jgi:anti-sigma factor ChrR (cupin superfamily)